MSRYLLGNKHQKKVPQFKHAYYLIGNEYSGTEEQVEESENTHKEGDLGVADAEQDEDEFSEEELELLRNSIIAEGLIKVSEAADGDSEDDVVMVNFIHPSYLLAYPIK